MHIGERIKKRRIELGLSQDQLAQALGYKSRSSINMIEQQKTDITKSKIEKFAKVLQTSPAYLMGWEEKNDAGNDIILRFRTDDEFRAIMKSVNNFSPELLNALKAFISIFEK